MTGTTIGLQIPSFTYPGVGSDTLFQRVADQATTAEESGFDTVFVMDHFFQLPLIGPPELEMFEAYTLLGALAARTSSVRLGTLVTGVTYRNPALLAKQVTALDVISRGRALLGIGAAWFEEEHDALGFEFPPLSERYERLTDALAICRAMFTETRSTVEGTHHRIDQAWNHPRPVAVGGPPILIGGQGERRTFPLAVAHADELNINASFVDLPHKLEVLDGLLGQANRNRDTLTVTNLGTLVVEPTHDAAAAKLVRLLQSKGVSDAEALVADEQALATAIPRLYFGDPDEVGQQVEAVRSLGLDGIVVNLLADDGDADAVALAGQTLNKALG